MKRFVSLSVLVVAAGALLAAQGGSVIVIRNTTLIDGTGRASIPGATVVIDGNTIRSAGPNVQPPAGARVIDGTGKFLIPGMIDAHVHLRGGRGAGASAADPEREGIRALHSYLYAGVTTIFDAGNRSEYIMGLMRRSGVARS